MGLVHCSGVRTIDSSLGFGSDIWLRVFAKLLSGTALF